MKNIEKAYQEYRSQLRTLEEQKDAWYTIAGQKFSEGDSEGQRQAYNEIDKITDKIKALVDPFQGDIVEDPSSDLRILK